MDRLHARVEVNCAQGERRDAGAQPTQGRRRAVLWWAVLHRLALPGEQQESNIGSGATGLTSERDAVQSSLTALPCRVLVLMHLMQFR